MERRKFIRGGVVTSAAVSLAATRSLAATQVVTDGRVAEAKQKAVQPDGVSPNARVRVGLIGCGGRGMYVATHMRNVPNVEFVAVCDVHQTSLLRAQAWAGAGCDAYRDFRQVLDRNDIDAVLIATPDHWHAIITILACQAGKDVYVEKPLGLTIHDGRAMVQAARDHACIVQTGMQQRSAAHIETMRDIIRDGRLGNVRFVRIWNYQNTSPGRLPQNLPSSPPQELDWDFFLGPAPKVAYDPNRYSNFRRYWDYSGGLVTDYGTHRFDSMRQAMSLDSLPLEDSVPMTVSATGGRYEVHDGSEDPDMIQVTYQFKNFVLSYEASLMNAFGSGYRTPGRPYYRMLGTHDRPHGMAFYGTEGTIFADRLGFELYPELKPGRRADKLKPEDVTADLFRTASASGRSEDSTYLHAQNFIECIRSRKSPSADVAIGHASSLLPHLGNIAYRTGEKIIWDAANETISNSEAGTKMLRRDARKPWDLV